VRHEVKVPIAGSVWSHVAVVGQRVEIGSVLLVCECMKTEIPIDAPVAGTVAWLRPCSETVEAGDVVAELDVA
jgi:acetyl-CoA carboxylase biotin carboxyl carrier protein